MSPEDAFAVWAPAGVPWSPWVKPILFASQDDWSVSGIPELEPAPDLAWLESEPSKSGYRRSTPRRGADRSLALVLDLPSASAVPLGIELARRGFRPVPLYNAIVGGFGLPTPSTALQGTFFDPPPTLLAGTPLLDVRPIVTAMRRATSILATLSIPVEAPPVFLLDAERRYGQGRPSPGRFDNRSVSLPTDFPSAVFLRSRGIARVIVVQARLGPPQDDLAHTLFGWQSGGLRIELEELQRPGPPRPITVERPSHFGALTYRFLATLGLRRSPLGGFGAIVPEPKASS